MPQYKIIGVGVMASYDAVTTTPGNLRPAPSVISAEVETLMSESIKLQDVYQLAKQAVPINAVDLTAASAAAASTVQTIINSNVMPPGSFSVDVDVVSGSYQPNSTGGHNTVSWIRKVSGGNSAYWTFNVKIQGQNIQGFACLIITLLEV